MAGRKGLAGHKGRGYLPAEGSIRLEVSVPFTGPLARSTEFMPVQFHCSQCRRNLSVGQRKSGATVACPKCGAPNVVPRLEPVAAAPAATPPPSEVLQSASEPIASYSAGLSEAVAFDEIPNLIAMIDSMPVAPPPVTSPPPIIRSPAPSHVRLPEAAQAGPGPSATPKSPARLGRRGRRDDTLLLVSRKAIYAQAVLMAVVTLAALAAGYVIGRGVSRTPTNQEAGSIGDPVVSEQLD